MKRRKHRKYMKRMKHALYIILLYIYVTEAWCYIQLLNNFNKIIKYVKTCAREFLLRVSWLYGFSCRFISDMYLFYCVSYNTKNVFSYKSKTLFYLAHCTDPDVSWGELRLDIPGGLFRKILKDIYDYRTRYNMDTLDFLRYMEFYERDGNVDEHPELGMHLESLYFFVYRKPRE